MTMDSSQLQGLFTKRTKFCKCPGSSSYNSNCFSIVLANSMGEEVQIGYDKATNQYFIDRTKSGKVDFQKDPFIDRTDEKGDFMWVILALKWNTTSKHYCFKLCTLEVRYDPDATSISELVNFLHSIWNSKS